MECGLYLHLSIVIVFQRVQTVHRLIDCFAVEVAAPVTYLRASDTASGRSSCKITCSSHLFIALYLFLLYLLLVILARTAPVCCGWLDAWYYYAFILIVA